MESTGSSHPRLASLAELPNCAAPTPERLTNAPPPVMRTELLAIRAERVPGGPLWLTHLVSRDGQMDLRVAARAGHSEPHISGAHASALTQPTPTQATSSWHERQRKRQRADPGTGAGSRSPPHSWHSSVIARACCIGLSVCGLTGYAPSPVLPRNCSTSARALNLSNTALRSCSSYWCTLIVTRLNGS